MAHISKSAFVKGVQCSKQLYYYKNNYNDRDPLTTDEQVKFKRGVDVGVMAQQLFPGGKDLTPASPWQYKQATAVTRHFLEQGLKVLYEASFLYNGLYAIMDIVVNENGVLKAYEVKNTRSVKDQHLLDASFQYYVISQSGFTINSICIVHPNQNLDEVDENIPLAELFVVEDITDEVIAQQTSIALQTENFIGMVGDKEPPAVSIGNQCFKPYTCGFMRLCWQGAKKEQIDALLEQDIDFREVAKQKMPGL